MRGRWLLLLLLMLALPAAATTLSENWNCTNSASLSCQLTWTEPTGTQLGIVGNRAQGSGNISLNTARTSAGTATQNQIVTATLVTFTHASAAAFGIAIVCRYSASAETFYYFQASEISGTLSYDLIEVVAGSETSLGSSTQDPVAGDVMQLSCIGSAITAKVNGVTVISATSTTITGNTQAGIRMYLSNVSNLGELDDFSAADAATQPFTESWNCTNSATLTCDQTWTEPTGGNWTITSNQAQLTGNVSTNTARAEIDTNTVDQSVTATLKTFTQGGTNLGASLLCRYSSSAETYYEVQATNAAGTLLWYLGYTIAGTATQITTNPQDPAVNDVVTLQCVGTSPTTLTVIVNGATLISTTDSHISTGTRAGIAGYADNAGSTVALDAFSFQDYVAAATGGSGALMLRGVGP